MAAALPPEPRFDGVPFELESLYRAFAPQVAHWAQRLGGTMVDVDDVVHEVFLVAQRRRPAARDGGQLKTWFYRTTEHVVRHRRRKDKWRQWLSGSTDEAARDVATRELNPLEALERQRKVELLYKVLDGMAERYRTAFLLFEVEGLTGEEAEALTGTKLATLRVWLFRARDLFAKRLAAMTNEGASTSSERGPSR